MGLLDEAIREHLDLKRRHGADPTEVERAEREALGPVRRAQAGDGDETDEVEDRTPGEVATGHEPEAGGPDEVSGGVAFDHETEDDSWSFEDAPAHEADPGQGPKPPATGDAVGQETAVHRPDFLDEEPFADQGDQSPPPQPAGGETVEYDVERAHRSHSSGEEDGEGEELLEETPEFLQDTPDHDRLWFEQRPPKDFDFDG